MSSLPAAGHASSAQTGPSAGATTTVLLAVAAFVIVTTEFVLVGLLPPLARDLSIPVATAGQLVTLFALVVMLAGPPLTAWLAHVERKRMFLAVLVLFAVSNAVAALAPNVWVLAVARIVPALALPVFWGTASDTAAQLAGPARAGRAVATVYLGISAAMLLGIPLGTVAANALGWRGAFWALSLLAALVAVLLQWVMPTTRATAPVSLRTQARILRDPAFVGNVLLSVTVFTAMFTGYTYLAEFLETAALVPAAQVGWWLMGFGAVGLAGNWLGGRWVDRHPLGTTALFSLILAGGMLAAMGLAATPVALALALGLWGVANTALYPICQIRVMKSAPQSQALAGTINVSAANGGIALGAFLGGASLSSWGVRSVTLVGAGLAVLAAVVAMALGRWLQTRAATQA